MFKSLIGGAKFDHQRFKKDVTRFNAKKVPAPVGTPAQAVPLSAPGKKRAPPATRPPPPPPKATQSKDQRRRKRHKTPLLRRPISEMAAKAMRKKLRISVRGNDVPTLAPYVQQLVPVYGAPQYIQDFLAARGYPEPTPIQMQAWPVMLQKRDLIACAPTGSGKTLAFLVPLLALLGTHSDHGLRALIISPTKELSQQTQREATRIVAGAPEEGRLQLLRLSTAATKYPERLMKHDLLICTPKRLLDVLKEGHLKVDCVEHFIVDEADRLFEEGFQEQLDELLQATTKPGLTKCFFSATITEVAEDLARSVLHDPVKVRIGMRVASSRNVEQRLVFSSTEEGKLLTVRQILSKGVTPPVLIFLDSKVRAQELWMELRGINLLVDHIHAGRPQEARDAAIRDFRLGKLWCLICTDLMARGIDFKGVGTVINYDLPTSAVAYVHRVGRTGRAGKRGEAYTLFTPADADALRSIAQVIRRAGCPIEPWMMELKKPGAQKRRDLKRHGIKRPHINLMKEAAEQQAKQARERQRAAKAAKEEEEAEDEKETEKRGLKRKRRDADAASESKAKAKKKKKVAAE